ncbi:HNH endonuclease [Alloactinosynnema sp. L-07]|uniref:HNH endonuclease n=1 Tax=Alloactinosynnema sp. L-07 TaxID=1653480 RepID=UPI0006B5AEF7|nr:HNH endonuclease [Alloactinosynnema sp. L-07]
MPGQWAGSTRRDTLPPDWAERVAQVKARDRGRCQWPEHGTTCGQPGRDVDHIHGRHNHSLTNLRLLCGWHHDRKSSAEGNATRVRHTNRRPPEPHPGLRPPPEEPPPF